MSEAREPVLVQTVVAPFLIELHLSVDAMHPLVISRPVHLPQPVIALPEGLMQLSFYEIGAHRSVIARDTVVGT